MWQEVSRRTKEVGEEWRKEGTNEGRKDKRRRADRSRGGCGLLKGRYGLSRLTGGGSGGCFLFFYRLWKASGKGGYNWCRSLASKQAAKNHTLETRRVCMRTPTHSFHLLWFRQPSC